MLKNTYILFACTVVLSGCQVTGEQNNIYQKALSYSGQSTKSEALNGTQNRFSIIVPKSNINSSSKLKGLIANQKYFASLTRSQFADHIWKGYYSTLRPLSESTTKLRICNNTFAENTSQPATVSNSCSEVTLKTDAKDIGNGYQINFEGINVDHHQQSFALSKVEVPNVYSSVGILDQNLLKSTFGYYDQIEFKASQRIEHLPRNISSQFSQTRTYKENNENYYQLIFNYQHSMGHAVAPVHCETAPVKQNQIPWVKCEYAIFAKQGLSDYRPYKTQIEQFIKKTF